jgi:HlyD family secretion protein
MDKKIRKKIWTVSRIATYSGITLFATFVVYLFVFAERGSVLNVDKSKITISTVARGVFQERIPQTGLVEPSRSVHLDAVEGGTIKRILAESGAMMQPGDVILELSNLNRELAVLEQEAQLNASINQLRQTRLQLQQNDLQQQQTLADVEKELAKLTPQFKRQERLYEKKLIALQDFESIEADYRFNLKRKDIVYRSYRNDSIERIRQLKDLDVTEFKMLKSLEGAPKILDNLVIRAPIAGQLALAELDPGQNVNQGQPLGKVDVVGSYKVRVPIDELYLPRITTGLPATVTLNNKTYDLEITKMYPTVETGGRFFVDMKFVDQHPAGIRSGQSLRMLILLGQSSEELLLPMGGFYKDTGGNWVFVLENEHRAVRRNIKLGRKSGSEYFEVLDGLSPGERVITSSYETFGNNEILNLR